MIDDIRPVKGTTGTYLSARQEVAGWGIQEYTARVLINILHEPYIIGSVHLLTDLVGSETTSRGRGLRLPGVAGRNDTKLQNHVTWFTGVLHFGSH